VNIPPRLLERIETFQRNADSHLAPDYKEARLREEFLNPFFEELGWDMANRAGYAATDRKLLAISQENLLFGCRRLFLPPGAAPSRC
jgi:hypothetical protein